MVSPNEDMVEPVLLAVKDFPQLSFEEYVAVLLAPRLDNARMVFFLTTPVFRCHSCQGELRERR